MATNWTPRIEPRATALTLAQWGHLATGDPEAAQMADAAIGWQEGRLREALASYQYYFFSELTELALEIHKRGIKPDGVLGPATETLLMRPRCACPDRVSSGPQEANWPNPCRTELKLALLFEALKPLSKEKTQAAFDAACRNWTEALRLSLTRDDSLGRQAHIWAGDGPLAGGTLAWSYLAMNTCAAHLEQRYNTRVDWDEQYLEGVGGHELGHALGLDHDPSQSALMYPYARREVFRVQERDIVQAIAKGYERRTGVIPPDPDPKPGPTPGPDVVSGTININGRPYELVAKTAGGGSGGTKWGVHGTAA